MDLTKFQIVDELQYDSSEIETIAKAVAALPKGKKLEFNYKDTEDFKYPIGDLTGFASRVRNGITAKLKEVGISLTPSVLLDRSSGVITISLTQKS